tara:strand:+ start:645 stop:1115 length:471 start_codon:yes stop_codon:yes gene_type:complete
LPPLLLFFRLFDKEDEEEEEEEEEDKEEENDDMDDVVEVKESEDSDSESYRSRFLFFSFILMRWREAKFIKRSNEQTRALRRTKKRAKERRKILQFLHKTSFSKEESTRAYLLFAHSQLPSNHHRKRRARFVGISSTLFVLCALLLSLSLSRSDSK